MEKSIVNSSSPPVSSSDDANFSQSSATTISENSEVIFARTLHGRLAKVSRDHDLFQKHLQTFSSNWSRSLTRRTTLRRQPTVRFQDKRSKSDSFSSTKYVQLASPKFYSQLAPGNRTIIRLNRAQGSERIQPSLLMTLTQIMTLPKPRKVVFFDAQPSTIRADMQLRLLL
ncbi:hypothetical protein BDP27DRAFT_244526 [Rhodocollybia butyracea]|uniref:Uncharacterized protein n=1 Tax=Rhodocollybia butyracea TaxID=206335 RepID=A0A9P5Q2R7_9AGAR|nr:hypothetical protein BDP27DRAFT_244526 [Rhodocollybia butyracea]